MNTNWKIVWKERANEKANDSTDHYQYCILKALFAKSNNKVEIAQSLLRRAFTPTSYGSWTGLNSAARAAAYRQTIFGMPIADFMDNTQKEAYFNLIKECQGSAVQKSEPDYLFVFVRQDLSPEQQLVQAGHAAYKAGCEYQHNPDHTHFVVIGVKDKIELSAVHLFLSENNAECVYFEEGWLDNEMTAIATKPMKQHQKRFLKGFKLLTFQE